MHASAPGPTGIRPAGGAVSGFPGDPLRRTVSGQKTDRKDKYINMQKQACRNSTLALFFIILCIKSKKAKSGNEMDYSLIYNDSIYKFCYNYHVERKAVV